MIWFVKKSPTFYNYFSLQTTSQSFPLIKNKHNYITVQGFLIKFTSFRCWISPNYCSHLKIISLNVWGMPKLLGGGEYKTERMEAIGNIIAQVQL